MNPLCHFLSAALMSFGLTGGLAAAKELPYRKRHCAGENNNNRIWQNKTGIV
jgi:hypothetical protein